MGDEEKEEIKTEEVEEKKEIESYVVEGWPPLPGSYLAGDPTKPVAIVTLASELDNARLLKRSAICGDCKTENIGTEKVIANLISNSHIRYVVVCGAEVHGHITGKCWKALFENGVDDTGRIIDAPGAIPYLTNLPPEAIDRVRKQLELVDLINVEDEGQIESAIDRLEPKGPYEEEPMLVKLGGAMEEEVTGVLGHTGDSVSIESRIRHIEQEYKDLGKLQKVTAGLVGGLYQGFVLGLILTIIIFGIRRLLG